MTTSILLVEDNLTDAELITEAFKELEDQFPHHIDLISDGEEALALLQQMPKKPHLVLLDLNLPRKSGLEILHELRHDPDPALSLLPVIVLSNSQSRNDVSQAYASRCNAYIRKPLGFPKLAKVIRRTASFWFQCATLPGDLAAAIQTPTEPPPPPSSE